jgi:hypothetical protein
MLEEASSEDVNQGGGEAERPPHHRDLYPLRSETFEGGPSDV